MDRVVLITGAGGGIGRATARLFARKGDRIALLGRAAARLEDARREAASAGGGAAVHLCDVRDAESVERAVQGAIADFGRIDIAVLAAGVFRIASLADTSPEAFRETIETNLCGPFHVARAVVPSMLAAGGGHLVFLSSVAGRRVFPDSSAYCSSKWGVMGLSGALREELRGRGIRVTTIVPGAVATGLWDGVSGDWDRSRMLQPEDVARAILAAVQSARSSLVEEVVLAPPGGDL